MPTPPYGHKYRSGNTLIGRCIPRAVRQDRWRLADFREVHLEHVSLLMLKQVNIAVGLRDLGHDRGHLFVILRSLPLKLPDFLDILG